MNLINRYGNAILAVAALLIISGSLLALKLPNSLLPELSRPQIELYTNWPGKTASQIEQSLVVPLEQQLRNVAQLTQVTSNIRAGGATTVLDFQSGADMKQAYIDVLSASRQVPAWPSQVSPPFIEDFSNGASATLASFFVYHKDQSVSDPDALIDAYRFYVEPAFAKIPGISGVVVGTPIEQRIDIEFDPNLLIKHSLSQAQVLQRLNNFVDRSGGALQLGAREYDLQFKGQVSLENLSQVAISVDGEHIIRLGDIAQVKRRLASDWGYFALEGKRSLYFFLQPAKGISVLDTINSIKQLMVELNTGPLQEVGVEVSISRDDSVAISDALWLIYGSLVLGIILACGVLYYFLRHKTSVVLVFLSIPFCLAVVAILMFLFGYSLNVISLAGMALSIGLILDAAIIVVETINRMTQKNKSSSTLSQQDIDQSIAEVRSALLSSILSSIVVFLPMLFMDSNEGALFKDLAFTISSALAASALFALIVLPQLYRKFITNTEVNTISSENFGTKKSGSPIKPRCWLAWPIGKPKLASVYLFLAIPFALIVTYLIRPPIDVLPDPKQNILSGFIRFEDPLSVKTIEQEYAKPMVARIKKQLSERSDLGIRTHGMFCFPTMCQVYFYTDGNKDFSELKQWLESEITKDLIGTQVFSRQGGLLRFAMPDSRVTQVDIQGGNLALLQESGTKLLSHLRKTFPEARVDEASPLSNRANRIEFTPIQDQIVYLGLSPDDVNQHLLALSDGVYLGDFYTGDNTLPFYFKAKDSQYLDQLLDTEIVVPNHGLVPLRELVHAEIKLAPESISRINGELSASIAITPPQGQAMGDFTQAAKPLIQDYMKKHYPDLHINYRGSADNLDIFLSEFMQIFLAALVILTILMYLSLNSWSLSFAVLLSMPLAILGGMLNLKLLNVFVNQNLDIITMIGFIILMGLVINNAILLASQYRQGLQHGLNQVDSIYIAINKRKRAIYMSTGTSILGMLPLMISPANSAEIYRGLAAVICGGMVFSALFSISFMSALLSSSYFSGATIKKQPQENNSPVAT